MNAYYDRDTTPLNFHAFYRYFSLPVGFLVIVVKIFGLTQMYPYGGWGADIDMAVYFIDLILIVVCFWGFAKWNSAGWYGVMSRLWLAVGYNVFLVFLYAYYVPKAIGTAIGTLLGSLLYAIPIGIYYKKRKPLFFPDMTEALEEPEPRLSGYEAASQRGASVPPIMYCRKCGNKLLPESDFCSKCGAPIIKE